MREINNRFDLTIKALKRQYWISIIVLVLLFFLIMFNVIPNPFTDVQISDTVNRYAIALTLVAIPSALWLFAEILKKVPPGSTVDVVISKYRRASNIRIYIINAVTLINVVLYGITRDLNYFWLTAILLLVYIYCKPSFTELANLYYQGEKSEEKDNETKGNIHNNHKSKESENLTDIR